MSNDKVFESLDKFVKSESEEGAKVIAPHDFYYEGPILVKVIAEIPSLGRELILHEQYVNNNENLVVHLPSPLVYVS